MKQKNIRRTLFILCTMLMISAMFFTGQALMGEKETERELFILYPKAEEEAQVKESKKELNAFLKVLLPIEEPISGEVGFFSELLIPKETETEQEKTENSKEKNDPDILIYHTHTTEAYRPTKQNQYKATGDSRTDDPEKNIIAVGEALKENLEKLGFSVVHDTSNHEPPKLATAYSRSEKTMQAYQEKYPNLSLMIDVHRDAANVEENQDDIVEIDGVRCARMMFVVGNGIRDNGTTYEPKPYYEENLSLASNLTEVLEGIKPGFMRKIRIKNGRYNQHISKQCLLVEIGHNANTLEEAKASTKYLAKAIAVTVT